MAINFPDSPNNGDSFTSNNKTWVFDGTVWNITSGTNSVADGAITTAKIASNAVHQTKLASNLSAITVTTTANRGTDVASPFTGQTIYLSDVKRLQVWDGSAWMFITNGAPGAPTALSATVLSTTSVSVAFTTGTINGASPTNYKYSLSTNGGSTYGEPIALDPADAVSPVVISGLTTGTTYHIKLRAVSDFGDSPDSTATSITIPAFTVDYLVIAGGGGGGGRISGGGGAGGYRANIAGESSGGGSNAEASLVAATSTNYTVQIGGGGAAGVNFNTMPTSGVNSIFSTFTSVGGGYSGTYQYAAAVSGGSGGGGAGLGPIAGGAGTANQGFAGGTANNNSQAGAGGGGAGSAGANTSASGGIGGNGGAGVTSSITGSSVSRAGGGGGGGSGSAGSGSAGGGNGGATTNNAFNATANTGSGGGGARNDTDSASVTGGNGGSGVVILRYPSLYTITLGAGLTGTTTTVSSNKVTTITAGSGNVSWA